MVLPTLPPAPLLGGADRTWARGEALAGTVPRHRFTGGLAAPRGQGRGGWWLAIAVVAGLMAMHGFGTHGSHSATTSSQAHHAANAMVGHAAAASSAGGALLEAAASPLTSDSGGSSLLGLCLALLTVGLTWFVSRTGSRLAWTVPRMTTALGRAALPMTAHTLDPPSRAELCIWRC